MNIRVDWAGAKNTYRFKLSNFSTQDTYVQVWIFIDIILQFRYKPTSSNDFNDYIRKLNAGENILYAFLFFLSGIESGQVYALSDNSLETL